MTATLALALALGACSASEDDAASPVDPFAAGEWIDLTHSLAADSVFWPTAEEYEHEEVAYGETDGGYFYSSYNLSLSEHGGTHLDAPIHFAANRQTADEIPLSNLIGPAAVIDISAGSAQDADYLATPADILAWEDANGPLPDGAIVLFRTGFSERWPDRVSYLGTDLRGDAGVAALHFPGISEEAARLLAEQRNVAAVGIDTASLDYGQSSDYIAHQILLGADIPGFENVDRLDLLPAAGAHIIALPTKVEGGSGAPLRIIAFVPGDAGAGQ